MTNFEKMFDNLDVQSTIMDQVMDNVNANSYAESDVQGLINQVAEENGMKVSQEFEQIGIGGSKVSDESVKSKEVVKKKGENELRKVAKIHHKTTEKILNQ